MRKPRTRASALLIVLAAIVLVSTIVLTFYIQSTLSRQISFSSSSQFRAEKISAVALDIIVNDLRQEIVAGSVKTTVGANSVYVPNTNFTVVPFRVGEQGLPNVVKKSVAGATFWTNTGTRYSGNGPIRALSPASSTATASANGRKVDKNRWNASYLFGDTTPAAFTAPDWILVTRSGVSASDTPQAMSVMSDAGTNNANFVIGRFAYTIFDEGGLLDVNVAGFPNGVSDDFIAKRGLLPQVDLANIPGFDATVANNLVVWRNQASAGDAENYAATVYSSPDGFTTVKEGDQTFISRKDLIGYIKENGIPTSALQYLGTFSRELNAPSFTPDPSRKKVGNASFNPNTRGKDNDYNPSLINSRVTDEFVRASDDTTAVVGESLIKYRFPLSRLAWIGRDGPKGASAKLVEDSFGLRYELSAEGYKTWRYVHGAGDQGKTILSLADVARAKREPDFFELLQAAIHLGSLAKGSPFEMNRVPLDPNEPDLNSWHQIMQIGANIIDQYDGDSFPSRLMFDGKPFAGVENLPYINRVAEVPLRDPGPTLPGGPNVAMWYQPELWNPHALAGAPSPSPVPTSSGGPSQLKFVTIGTTYVMISDDSGMLVSPPQTRSQNSNGITISLGTNRFSQPTFLSTASGCSASGAEDILPTPMVTPSAQFFDLGIFVGRVANVPEGILAGGVSRSSVIVPQSRVTHQLQYNDGGVWTPYDEIANVRNGLGPDDRGSFEGYYVDRVFSLRSDPRVSRFGIIGSAMSQAPNPLLVTIRPDATEGLSGHAGTGGVFQGWVIGSQNGPYAGSAAIGLLSENKSTSITRYADPDLEQRRADGAYTVGSGLEGLPLAASTTASRPVMLDRPFRSVGELAYASRGAPWKSLDFFTPESGDSALLDVFCVNESPNPPVIAGRIDLNTRQTPVLAAILQGALISEVDKSTISKTDAENLAKSLIARTSGTASGVGPLLNRNELVTKWAQELVYSSNADTIIKYRREAAIRALADVGTTRSWNLLIDVVAQSGRYMPTATNRDQFIVEGERRFWMHVSIDRFTGKVISSHTEPVYE